jgi:hypothetical protein
MKFLTGTGSVKDAAKSSQLYSKRQANVSKVRNMIESDGNYVCDFAKGVGISLSQVHCIVKRVLKVQKYLPNGYHIYSIDK